MKKTLLLIFSILISTSSFAELDGEAFALRKQADSSAWGSNGYLKNPKEAINLYKKYLKRVGTPTLENDSRNVMHTIGSLYWDALNNPKEALIWYNKSAELGFFSAQLTLGIIYFEGEIVTKSLEQSAYWIKTAYENPSEYAQGNSTEQGQKHLAKDFWDKNDLWKY